MTALRSGAGEVIHLGPEIGRGGEGTVYSIQGKPGLAAKIYSPELAKERHAKIAAMTAAKWQTTPFVAFPIDTLFNTAGLFRGFSMPMVGGHKAVHELYSPTSRKSAFPKATYPFLVRCVVNIARAMAGVHATGCVVGDINHSGILVSDTATVTLIDADSFQVTRNGTFFPCKVGVQEFTPPELQGKPLDKVVRTENHDAFGLAVLLFYTLFMGRHPYAGRYLGSGDMPMDRAIKEFRFAYSSRRSALQMEPPPNVPVLSDLPLNIADAFELSFGPAGSNSARPTAKDWVALLSEAEGALVRCTANNGHHYFRQAASCPWCRMEKAHAGFQAFAPVIPTLAGSAPVNLAQLINAVQIIPDPGAPPALRSLIPTQPILVPSPLARDLRSFRRQRLSLAMVCGAVGVASSAFPSIGSLIPYLGLGASAVALFSAFRGGGSRATLDIARAKAEQTWKEKEDVFAAAASNQSFIRIRADAQLLISQIQRLPAEEQKRIGDLTSNVQQAQLKRFLESHSIETAKIKSLGTARKLTLRSYGIETAYDVDRARIERIHGFGPAKAQTLVAWRRSIEAKFRFDPRRGVDARDIATVKADIAKRQIDGETRLRSTVLALRKASADALAARSGPRVADEEALALLEQAEFDLDALRFPKEDRRLLMSIAILSVFFGVVPHLVALGPSNSSSPATNGKTDSAGGANRTSVPIERTGDRSHPPIVKQAPPSSAGSSPTPNETATGPYSPGDPLPPLPPPREIQTPPNAESSFGSEPLLDLGVKDHAVRAQQRLKELGFLLGKVDGVWGNQSRSALRSFKKDNGLGDNDQWDIETQRWLLDARW